MQKKTGLTDDKSVNDEDEEDEKNRDNESDKSSFSFISDTKDTKFTGPVSIANVQYLYQYINIKTIQPQLIYIKSSFDYNYNYYTLILQLQAAENIDKPSSYSTANTKEDGGPSSTKDSEKKKVVFFYIKLQPVL